MLQRIDFSWLRPSIPIASASLISGGWTNQAPYRASINEKLRDAAEKLARKNVDPHSRK